MPPDLANRKPRVVVTHWIHDEIISLLEEFTDPVVNPTRESWSKEALLEHCREAEGMIAFMPDSIDAAFLDRCPKLRIVAGALKGYDNFDLEACAERGVVFTHVPDLLTVPTAELAVALLLGVSRNTLEGDQLVRSGRFSGWRPILYGSGLADKTVGLVGFGAVGRAFAQRIRGFECRLVATEPGGILPELEEAYGVSSVTLEELVCQSDVVSLFLPLNSRTRHLVDAEFLSRLSRNTVLLNVCRGSVVDEDAVADSLEKGHLGAYAADVFEMEDWALRERPREISPRLLALREKTLFTPHLGSAVDEVRRDIARESVLQLRDFFRGEIPRHALTPSSTIRGGTP